MVKQNQSMSTPEAKLVAHPANGTFSLEQGIEAVGLLHPPFHSKAPLAGGVGRSSAPTPQRFLFHQQQKHIGDHQSDPGS
jgi:hypothetical protein